MQVAGRVTRNQEHASRSVEDVLPVTQGLVTRRRTRSSCPQATVPSPVSSCVVLPHPAVLHAFYLLLQLASASALGTLATLLHSHLCCPHIHLGRPPLPSSSCMSPFPTRIPIHCSFCSLSSTPRYRPPTVASLKLPHCGAVVNYNPAIVRPTQYHPSFLVALYTDRSFLDTWSNLSFCL